MSRDTQPMMGEPVSEDEVERRRALIAAFYAERTLPPLYRLSTMAARVTWGTLDGSRARTRFVFERDDALDLPRAEVHTFESGAVEDAAPGLWQNNFDTALPSRASEPPTVGVLVSESLLEGKVMAATSDGWMVSVHTTSHPVLIIGPGALPEVVSLTRVDIDALAMEDLA